MLCAAGGVVSGQSLAGRWVGSVQIPEFSLPLVIDFARDNAGEWVGSAILPGRGIKGAELREIKVQGGTVSFAIPRALGGLTLRGRMSGDALQGEMNQAGNAAPFQLRREGEAQYEPPRRSTSIRKEMEGEWKGSYELLGYPRQVTLKLANEASGAAKADLVIVGKRVNQIPVDLVILDGDFLLLESGATQITLELRHRGSGLFRGTFVQGPFEAEVELRRGER